MSSLPTFTSITTAKEVATVFADHIRGKNVLVTGPTINGLGFETARALAGYANLVVIAGYNLERLKLAEAAITAEIPSANIRFLVLDLASLASVRAAAAQVNAYPEPLHVLIHNAAAPGGEFKLSEDHLEMHLAVDHVGPFLLTKLLAPRLLAAKTASYTPRVVYVSSSAHTLAGVDLAMLCTNPDPARYSVYGAYAQAKTANVLTARELSRRAGGRINAYSLHPGTIFTNAQLREGVKEHMVALGLTAFPTRRNSNGRHWVEGQQRKFRTGVST
ncbi:short chain dehydrogenase reductase [Mycena albidolilacea]|uniref:Short chain dehydrogenase reductase n=1 Tax=Mycena albidolilacea TaxID=1033008 RepID=A0AAD6ZUV4_9AGAR|nr:short chain dehydrogenase reductase [Mycena albidolilacea]